MKNIVQADKKEIFRIFIGWHRISNCSCRYSVIVYTPNKKVFSSIQNTVFSSRSKHMTVHRTNLSAIYAILNEFIKKYQTDCILRIYSQDDFIAFEYNQEYKKERKFSEKTLDMDLWLKIIDLIETNRLIVEMKNNGSTLTGLCTL